MDNDSPISDLWFIHNGLRDLNGTVCARANHWVYFIVAIAPKVLSFSLEGSVDNEELMPGRSGVV